MNQSHKPIQFFDVNNVVRIRDKRFYYKAKCQSCETVYGINNRLEVKTWRWHPSYSQMVYGFMCKCSCYEYVMGLSPCCRKPLFRGRSKGDFRAIGSWLCSRGEHLVMKSEKAKFHRQQVRERMALD